MTAPGEEGETREAPQPTHAAGKDRRFLRASNGRACPGIETAACLVTLPGSSHEVYCHTRPCAL
jgi:hypothetical protein